MDDLIIKGLKDISITALCSDNKKHKIVLHDFINVRESNLSLDNNNPDYKIDINILCSGYKIDIEQ